MIRTNKNTIGLFFLILVVLSKQHAFSQGRVWFGELGVNLYREQEVSYTGGSFKKSPGIGYFVNINNGGKRFAFGLQADYTAIDLQNLNNSTVTNNKVNLYEFYATARYYPMLPTLRFWTKGAIRFTAGVSLGAYSFYWRENDNYNYPSYSHLMWSPLQYSTAVFAGLCFSPLRNTSGLLVKLNYKPATYMMSNFPLQNFSLKQPFSISASIFIGSKIKT